MSMRKLQCTALFKILTVSAGILLLSGCSSAPSPTEDHTTADFPDAGPLTGVSTADKAFKKFTANNSGYQYSKFGYIEDAISNNQKVLFSQGIATLPSAMPTTNKIHYEGSAIFVHTEKDSGTGDAFFTVNFDTQTIFGNLSQNSEIPNWVQFRGRIDGNTFSDNRGRYGISGSNKEQTLSVRGQFYGNHAEELGGVFQNADNTFKGVFGGIKR